MKNRKLLAGVLAVVALVAIAAFVVFGHQKQKETKPQPTDGTKISVVASFYPMADFTKQIGGDKVDITTLIPLDQEPHDWEPTPNDAKKLQGAKLFVYDGLGMEPWAQSIMEGLGNNKPKAVEASHGADPLKAEHVEEESGDGDEHEHEHHGMYDPHMWLDPVRAKIMMNNIKEGLIAVDPQNKDFYEANYATASKKLDELNDAYKATLDPIKDKMIVVSHMAYGYICDRYNIKQIGIEGLEPDQEPDAKRMAEIVDMVKNHGITTIFYEDLVSPKVAKQIASETGAHAETLNPIEGLDEEQQKSGADYFSIMHSNLEQLKKALTHDKQ